MWAVVNLILVTLFKNFMDTLRLFIIQRRSLADFTSWVTKFEALKVGSNR